MANYKYPADYRAHAVQLWRTSGKSQRAVSLELGISNELLRRWVRQDDLDKGLPERRADHDRAGGAAPAPGRGQDPAHGARVPEKSRSLLRQGDRPNALRAFSLIEAEKANFPVSLMCRHLGVSGPATRPGVRGPRAPAIGPTPSSWA